MLLDVSNPLTNLIFPPRCAVCRRTILHDGLCSCCASMVTNIPPSSALLNGKKPAIFFYEGVIKRLIISAKFYRSLHDGVVLMRLAKLALADSLLVKEIETMAPDCISAVPTHWLRRIERRVDLPELFAQLLSQKLSLPCVSLLSKTSYFHHQTRAGTKAKRKEAIVSAFSCKKTRVSFKHVLLVDDIVTTGATFDESKKMLNKLGLEAVTLALARTP